MEIHDLHPQLGSQDGGFVAANRDRLGARCFGFRVGSPKMKGIGFLRDTPVLESQTTEAQTTNYIGVKSYYIEK